MQGKLLHLVQDYASAFFIAAEAIAPTPAPVMPLPDQPAIMAIAPVHKTWSAEASQLLWEDIQERSRTQPYIATYQMAALIGHVPSGPL